MSVSPSPSPRLFYNPNPFRTPPRKHLAAAAASIATPSTDSRTISPTTSGPTSCSPPSPLSPVNIFDTPSPIQRQSSRSPSTLTRITNLVSPTTPTPPHEHHAVHVPPSKAKFHHYRLVTPKPVVAQVVHDAPGEVVWCAYPHTEEWIEEQISTATAAVREQLVPEAQIRFETQVDVHALRCQVLDTDALAMVDAPQDEKRSKGDSEGKGGVWYTGNGCGARFGGRDVGMGVGLELFGAEEGAARYRNGGTGTTSRRRDRGRWREWRRWWGEERRWERERPRWVGSGESGEVVAGGQGHCAERVLNGLWG